jgi:3'-5' exoribonuclease
MADHPHDLLSIRHLKQVANPTPEPARIHAQIEACHTKETSNGKPYQELRINDGSEALTWRVFDNNPLFAKVAELKRGDWIELCAQWVDTGKYGLDPRSAELRVLTDDEITTLLHGDSVTSAQQRADFEDILTFASSITDPRLHALCQIFFQQHSDRFKRAAAAREYHHARRGGLVEHVAQMMRCAVKIVEAYPKLNRDLLIAGVLFHDCGKLWENNYPEHGFNMPYSIHGEMLGHIPLGLELVNKLWRQLLEQPEAAEWTTLEPANELVRLHLLHLIGSHHGEYQFGSPVLPKTPEAIVLHHVDNIDAKMEMFRRAYETGTELGHGILERVRPLPTNVISPLSRYLALDPAPASPSDGSPT